MPFVTECKILHTICIYCCLL